MFWLAVIGAVLVFESMMPLAFPRQWLRTLLALMSTPIVKLRLYAGIVFIAGLALMWLATQ